MLFGDMDISWIQITVTAAIGIITGAVMGIGGLYFWFGKQWRAARRETAETDLSIKGQNLAHDKLVSDEVKRTAEWQSDVFHKRQEELERQMSSMQNAMQLLHREHLDCLKRDKIKDGQFEVQNIKIASQGEEIIALKNELSVVRNQLYNENRILDQMRQIAREVIRLDAESAKGEVKEAEVAAAKRIGEAERIAAQKVHDDAGRLSGS